MSYEDFIQYSHDDDHSGRIPLSIFQHISSIVRQNVMMFFINYNIYVVLAIHHSLRLFTISGTKRIKVSF